MAHSVRIFWVFEAFRSVWTAVLEINAVICRPDSGCHIGPCFNNGNVEWIVSTGANRCKIFLASLSFFPHKQPVPVLLLLLYYPSTSTLCPLCFVHLLSLIPPPSALSTPSYSLPFFLPSCFYFHASQLSLSVSLSLSFQPARRHILSCWSRRPAAPAVPANPLNLRSRGGRWERPLCSQ